MNAKPASISRRQAVALATALTLAVATAGAAVTGINRTPKAATAAPAVVSPAQVASMAREVDD